MEMRNLTGEERREFLYDMEHNHSPALGEKKPTLEDTPLYLASDEGMFGYGQTREEAEAALMEALGIETESTQTP